MRLAGANVLVVPPFECAWLIGDDWRFAEAGRGCVAFEAMTENDVTVVFKEQAGSKHYRTDSGPSYTVVLGSHRNRRFKIEVDGQTVVDVPRVVLQPTHFGRYWINLYDGVLSVGKGDPGKGIFYQWVDSKPNSKIQFVGLSSWDKHVGYRNIQVLPALQPATSDLVDDSGGLGRYLESEELSDLHIVVGHEQRVVPTHWILLHLCCGKLADLCTGPGEVILLPHVQYSVLFEMLQYVYTGRTQMFVKEVKQVKALAEEFGLQVLASQCEEMELELAIDSHEPVKTTGAAERFDVVFKSLEKPEKQVGFLAYLPIDMDKLGQLLDSGNYSDVELSVDGKFVSAHRLILSAWSNPFAKMFTNGMRESKRDNVLIRDITLEPFVTMINFMYKGSLELGSEEESGSLLLSVLILADRFGIQLLHNMCNDIILECLCEDSACAVLLVAASTPNCQVLCDKCEELCAKHLDFCMAFHAAEFRQLEASCLKRILQHPELSVTSEEKMLDATLMWAANKDEICGWEDCTAYLDHCSEEMLFSQRLEDLRTFLPFIRFPFMSRPLLERLKVCNLIRHNQALKDLVLEALDFLGQNKHTPVSQSNVWWHSRLVRFPKSSMRFTPRISAYKELQYICDGDQNGVFHHIGTSYGLHQWMNPVLLKRMSVSASSPPSRFTDAKTLVSHNFQGTSFAGPCVEGGALCSWWKVDLGEDHQLMCNYYTIRQDGSDNFMRSWSFQGSTEGKNWVELSSHENEQTICQPGQYASWPLSGASANLPFRFFRIVLTGPTASQSNRWNFSICYLELYGYFQ